MDVTVNGEPQPVTEGVRMVSPELGAAMTTAAAAQAALARVLSWFADSAGTYRYARATRAQLAHAYQDGGLDVPEELRRFL